MEKRGEQDEAGHDAKLEDQSCFDESASHILFALRETGIRTVRSSIGVQSFHDGGDGAKGSDDASWVDGGMIGDVV